MKRYLPGRSPMIFILFPLAIFYMEMVLKIYSQQVLWFGVLCTLLFSIPIGVGCAILSSVWTRKVNRWVSGILMGIITLIIAIQCVYFTIFKTYTMLASATQAGGVLGEFWKETLVGIWDTKFVLILLSLPLIFLIVTGKRHLPNQWRSRNMLIVTIATILLVQVAGEVVVRNSTSGIMSYQYVYTGTFSPVLSVPRFGTLTTIRLEVANMINPKAGEMEIPGEIELIEPVINGEQQEETEVEYGYNVLEIDFEKLIEEENNETIIDMHNYFSNLKGTQKNKYTGMFEGKNLIWIVAEGFSSLAVNEEYTPTLYKMSNEGFVFNNFYNPIWAVSTSDGEYMTMTGLIPKSGVWSFSRSSEIMMPYGFGHIFGNLGYECRAYHNHTHTYYDRHLSHPNLGYDYKGVGNGLEVKKSWPESDLEMMELTINEYINADKFHTYYMTVSGHMNYTFMGNSMSYKHKGDVQGMIDAGYSEAACAYIACQMEFDQSIEYLIDQLEQAGKLDDTVIVISGDHYPYGLTKEEMDELAGDEIEEKFELFKSTLIIWNSDMETVEIDKSCGSIDIMPTILNLFGVEYDSRFVMGQDILSNSPGLVIFNDRSFLTDYGRYNSRTGEFTANEGVGEISDYYARGVMNSVNNKIKYSERILDNDYYSKVFTQ